MRLGLPHTRRRRSLGALLVVGLGLPLLGAACGEAASPKSLRGATTTAAHQCSGAQSRALVAVVVESSPASVVSDCVVGGAGISALAALRSAGVEVGTKTYSFGLAICQVDHVPAHYLDCLPAGQPYWALFVARGASGWSSASTGISGITLTPGDSLGLRYDPAKGSAAPPSVPPPLR